MIKAECDRCGKQARLQNGALPVDWFRLPVPPTVTARDGANDLCPECVNALAKFFQNDGAVPGLLELEVPRPPRCTCAGVGFGTEDCVLHHPDGLERGTHLKCYRNETGDTAGECPGIYRRGMFAEHMERWHGLKVAEGSKACPYCATIESGIWELGQHIAAEHPGDLQAWVDGGQHAG